MIAAALVLASALYVWQVTLLWATQSGTPYPSITRSTIAVKMRGIGLAAGATGTLSFDNRGARGTLQLWDMPVLPEGQVYQVWCTDSLGNVDSPIIFRVAASDQGESNMKLSTDRMLYAYSHFTITIEPDGGSSEPSSRVVMRNE